MKLCVSIIATMTAFCAFAEAPGTNVAASAGSNTAVLMGRKVEVSKDGSDFAGDLGVKSRRKKEAQAVSLRREHKADDIFLRMNGEVLTWGKIDDYVDLLLKVSPLNLPPQATVEEIEKIIAMSRHKLAEIAGNQFVQHWIVVPKAREAGIVVSQAEILAAISNSVRKVARKHKSSVLKASLDPEGYLYRKQVGYLISKKYFDQVVAKEISATDEEVAAAIAERKEEIAKTKEHNATLRPKIEGILQDIRSGKISFADAAFEYSDCGSSTEDGVFGEFRADKCKLLPPLKEFIFAPSTNELSEVIETPFSFHIVKILQRSYELDPEDDDEDEDESAEEVEK